MDDAESKLGRSGPSSGGKSDFVVRLQEVAGESIPRLAQRSGVSDSLLRQYLSGSQPRLDKLVAVARGAGVNLLWLATGEGPMRVDSADGAPATPMLPARQAPPRRYAAVEDSDEYVLVPRYDVRAAAGAGAIIEAEQVLDRLAFRRDWVRARGLDPRQMALIEADGDSMTPTVAAGDLLLLDLGRTRIAGDAIYVLRRAGELVVKRVQRLVDGTLQVMSDNPRYATETVLPDQQAQIDVVARVVWRAQWI